MIKLVVEERGATRTLEVDRDEVTIGRAMEAAVRIEDAAASRNHLRITRTEAGLFAEDLQSSNGTLLNDQPLRERKPVAVGDRISIGETTLHVGGRVAAASWGRPRARFALACTEGARAGAVFRICSFPCMVGRRAGLSLVLEEDGVSPDHCMLVLEESPADGAQVFVLDLNSECGTFVNGERVSGRARLLPGSSLEVGKTKLRLDDLGTRVPSEPSIPAAAPATAPPVEAVVSAAPSASAPRVEPAPVPPPRVAPASAPVAAPEPEADEEDEPFEDDDPIEQAAVKIVRASPWIAVSLAFHGIVLACLPLIILSYKLAERDDAPIPIVLGPKAVEKIDLGDRPRGVFERAGILEPDGKAQEEPQVFFPTAETGDHNESADGEDHRSMKGQDLDALSYLAGLEMGVKGRRPGQGVGVSDSIGTGAGSGGSRRFGTRFGGRRLLVRRGGGSVATESAVEAGLRWLARHQGLDGRWAPETLYGHPNFPYCQGTEKNEHENVASTHDIGVTSLAILAFLGAGHTPQSRAVYQDPISGRLASHGETVRKALQWLLEQQRDNGVVCMIGDAAALGGTGRTGDRDDSILRPRYYAYDHALATWALCEAFGITDLGIYKDPAQKAVRYLESAQSPGGGWRFLPRSPQSDTSVTGFAIMALKSARVSGLEVRDASFDGARTFLRTMTNMTGVCGYTDGSSMAPTAAGPALTAVGMFCRMFMDHDRNDPVLEKAATLIAATPPLWSTIDEKTGLGKHDYYAWYVGTIALFQYDGPSGSTWKTWNSALVHATCDTQRRRKDGCLDGSWDPDGDAFIAPGGRAAATAINVLSLETYYRYASVFGTTSSK